MIPRDPRDPPVTDTCATCGKPRELRTTSKLYRNAAERDPFCSNECAREWYGVSLATDRHGTGYGASLGLKADAPLANRG